MCDVALKSLDLEEDIPSLEALKQAVDSAYEHLIEVLKNWRSRNIDTLEKCHSVMVAKVNAALTKARETILIEVTRTSDDLLEGYFQTEDREVNLLKTEIKVYEEAMAKACVLSITSDLSQVQEIISREEVTIPCERCDTLKCELLIMARKVDETEKLQREARESLRECTEIRSSLTQIKDERDKLRGEVRYLKDQETAWRKNNEKYLSERATFAQELKLKN